MQTSLDQQKAELLAVRDRLEAARDRLERLRSELVTARRVLAARLVEIYKADSPDALTVILSSDGFGDLLERAEFLDRISDQDRQITDRVAGAGQRAHQATQLADLEEREQLAAERILRERDQIASVENQLVGRATSSPRRAPTSAARSPRCTRAAWRSRGTSRRSRRSRRASRPPSRAGGILRAARSSTAAGSSAGP